MDTGSPATWTLGHDWVGPSAVHLGWIQGQSVRFGKAPFGRLGGWRALPARGRPAILKGLNPPAQGCAAGALPWVQAGKPSNPVGVASSPGRSSSGLTDALPLACPLVPFSPANKCMKLLLVAAIRASSNPVPICGHEFRQRIARFKYIHRPKLTIVKSVGNH